MRITQCSAITLLLCFASAAIYSEEGAPAPQVSERSADRERPRVWVVEAQSSSVDAIGAARLFLSSNPSDLSVVNAELGTGRIGIRWPGFDPEIHPIDPILPAPGNQHRPELTAEALTCRLVANGLARQIGSVSDNRHLYLGNESIIEKLGPAIARWVGACLQTTGSPGEGFDLDVIRQVVGFVSFKGAPFCSGILVGPRRVITARHCFSPDSVAADIHEELQACAQSAAACGAIAFSSGGAPETPHVITGVIRPSVPFPVPINDQGDYIELDLAEAIGQVAVELVDISSSAPVFLGGFLPYLTQGSPDSTRPPLVWSRNFGEQCRATRGSNGCLHHNCQALWAFSGSPLIISAEKAGAASKVRIAGIHLGGATAQSTCWSLSTAAYNRALSASRIGL